MSACYSSSMASESEAYSKDFASTNQIIVAVSDELLAAVEGWRQVHGVEQSEAFSTLVRLGLLGEIAKIYRLVSNPRPSESDRALPKKPRRPESVQAMRAAPRPQT